MIKRNRILKSGDFVKVRSYSDIFQTLDRKGTLNGLPFMPEMKQFCGKTFRVHKRAHRVCNEERDRYIKDTVSLQNVRCDGGFHDNCKKYCMIMWKEAWLKRIYINNESFGASDKSVPEETIDFPIKYGTRYFCQSTEMTNATFKIATSSKIVQLMLSFFSEWRFKNQKFTDLIKNITIYILWKLGTTKIDLKCKVLIGESSKTPTLSLDLKSGERVRVKSEEEILKTLEKYGRNRGLGFSGEMFTFCGREFMVKERLDKMIHEDSGKMIELDNTVILEDVACAGQCRFGCVRNTYHFWREIWLERV
jgi:hypothetical protein